MTARDDAPERFGDAIAQTRKSSARLSPQPKKIHHGGTEFTEGERESDELSVGRDLALYVFFLPLRVPPWLRGEKSSRENKKSRDINSARARPATQSFGFIDSGFVIHSGIRASELLRHSGLGISSLCVTKLKSE